MTTRWKGFANHEWQVHKFGGTSVANARCIRQVAAIIEEKAAERDDLHVCVVVSAMGGKPKVTDLLLRSVEAASQRNEDGVEKALDFIQEKHRACLNELRRVDRLQDRDEIDLLETIRSDLNDIRDILKTVALMKWQAKRISELVSGYGELWSAQILARLLHRRQMSSSSGNRNSIIGSPSSSGTEDGEFGMIEASSSSLSPSSSSSQITHYTYMDARRIITVDEEAIQDGAVAWTTSQEKLAIAYQEELSGINQNSHRHHHEDDEGARNDGTKKVHLVCTGYVASNTHGVATTLQRDGSDYSAAILGRLLKATEINIWTDVSGVLSADPRRVPQAYPVPEVSYNEAMELAYFGAKVIHPKYVLK